MDETRVASGLVARIEKKRESLGNISLRQAALQIGINASTLLRITRGEQEPTKDTLEAILAWLGEEYDHQDEAREITLEHVHLRAAKNLPPDVVGVIMRMVQRVRKASWERPEPIPVRVQPAPWTYAPIRLAGRVREFELAATAIRRMAGINSDDERLDPFGLAEMLGLIVRYQDEIPGLSDDDRRLLSDVFSGSWSGATIVLDDESRVVVLNRSHNAERNRATVMEEICHHVFGHAPTSLKHLASAGAAVRDYDSDQEKEAYWTGAAALVPYVALKRRILERVPALEIADHFGVSEELVKFRIKTTGMWSIYQRG